MDITAVTPELDLTPPDPTRLPGLHVSDLYNSFYRAQQSESEPPYEPNPLKMALGLAWEAHLERCLHRQGIPATRPPGYQLPDGLCFSPDLLITDDHVLRVGEMKLTWMSSGYPLTDPRFDRWLTQAKTYCYHLKTNLARIYALHVNGDYRKSRNPQFLVHDLCFSQQELDDNWERLLQHGRSQQLL